MGISYKFGRYEGSIPFSATQQTKIDWRLIETTIIPLEDYPIGNEMVRAEVDWSGAALPEDDLVIFRWFKTKTTETEATHLFTFQFTFKKGWTSAWTKSWIGHKAKGEIDAPGDYHVFIHGPRGLSRRIPFTVTEKMYSFIPFLAYNYIKAQKAVWQVNPSTNKLHVYRRDHPEQSDMTLTEADWTAILLVPLPETTIKFWTDKGYSTSEAEKIVTWVKEHQQTPTPETIKEILAPTLVDLPSDIKQMYDALSDDEKSKLFNIIKGWTRAEQKDFVWTYVVSPDANKTYMLKNGTYVPGVVPITGWDFGVALAGIWALGATLLPLAWKAAMLLWAPTAAALSKAFDYVISKIGWSKFIDGLAKIGSPLMKSKAGQAAIQTTFRNGMGALVKQGFGAQALAHITKLFASGTTSAALWSIIVWNVLTDWVWIIPGVEKAFGGEAERARSLQWSIDDNLSKAHNLIHIDPTAETKAEALTILRTTKPLIEEYYKLIYSRGIVKEVTKTYPEFETALKDFVSRYNTLIDLAGGTSADKLVYDDLVVPEVEKIEYPKEFTLENVKVEDGDTLEFPDHPDVQNKIRFVGIDTHESGTTEGEKEADYLKGLIEGKTVTIKVDEFDQVGLYGRLLGGVFLDDEDIVLKMLAEFGESVLPASKYRTKFYWVDWDLYESTAKAGVPTPNVGEIKVNTKPTYASIYLDSVDTHLLSAEIIKDVPLGVHVVTLKKFGYDDKEISVNVEEPIRYEIYWDFTEPVDEDTPPEKVFRISINSTPSNAKLFLDDVSLHHNTPSNESELSDVMHLFTPGKHILKATKGGEVGTQEVDIIEGDNGTIYLTLAPEGLPVPPDEEPIPIEEFSINIDSTPSNAKLFIDGIYTKHWTPSDASELKDVMHLFTPGKHMIKVTKTGEIAEKEIEIMPGFNEPIFLTLGPPTLEPVSELTQEEILAKINELEKEITRLRGLL